MGDTTYPFQSLSGYLSPGTNIFPGVGIPNLNPVLNPSTAFSWDTPVAQKSIGSMYDTPDTIVGVTPQAPGMFDSFKSWFKDSGMLGSFDPKTGVKMDGWGAPALGALQGFGNAYAAMKQYGLQKQALEQGKQQFEKNFGAQKQMVNSQLEDRQKARLASNPGAYESLGSYLNKYAVR